MKRISFKIIYCLLGLVLGLFFSAFVYYYVEEGLYKNGIPLAIIFGIELLLEIFSLDSDGIIYKLKMGCLFIIMTYLAFIIIKIIIMHPFIFIGFMIFMLLFLGLLYFNSNDNKDEIEE